MAGPPPSSPPTSGIPPITRQSPRRTPPARLTLPLNNLSPLTYPTSLAHRRGSSDPEAIDYAWSTSSIPIMLDDGDGDVPIKGPEDPVPSLSGLINLNRIPPLGSSPSTQLVPSDRPSSSRRRPSHGISPVEFTWDAGSEPGSAANLARVDTESAKRLKRRAYLASAVGGGGQAVSGFGKARPRVLDDKMGTGEVSVGLQIGGGINADQGGFGKGSSPTTPRPVITPITPTPLKSSSSPPNSMANSHTAKDPLIHVSSCRTTYLAEISSGTNGKQDSFIASKSVSSLPSLLFDTSAPHTVLNRRSEIDMHSKEINRRGSGRERPDTADTVHAVPADHHAFGKAADERECTGNQHSPPTDPKPTSISECLIAHPYDQPLRNRQTTHDTTRTTRSAASVATNTTGSSLFDMSAYVRSESQVGMTEVGLIKGVVGKSGGIKGHDETREEVIGLGMGHGMEVLRDVKGERAGFIQHIGRGGAESLEPKDGRLSRTSDGETHLGPAGHNSVGPFEYDGADYFSLNTNRKPSEEPMRRNPTKLERKPSNAKSQYLSLEMREHQTLEIPALKSIGPTSSTIAEPGIYASKMDTYWEAHTVGGNHLTPLEAQLAAFTEPNQSTPPTPTGNHAIGHGSPSSPSQTRDHFDDPTSTFPGQAGYDLARFGKMGSPSTSVPATLKTPDKEMPDPFTREPVIAGKRGRTAGLMVGPLPGWNTMTPGSVHTMAQSPSWFDSPELGVGTRTGGKGAAEVTGRFRSETNESHASTKSLMKAFDKDSTVQLWIDQEGYRAVRASFKYVKSIPAEHFCRRTSGDGAKDLSSAGAGAAQTTARRNSKEYTEVFGMTGCIEFRMEQKEVWPFHSGSLERLPTLRRLTVDLHEEWDYLTRQALLNLRKNGVYRVSGFESKGKLAWTFEYMVDDRRSPTTGKLLSGEKTVLPLSFCCSPNLLSSSRARKAHLFNILRKTVTPRIASAKLAPPRLKVRTLEALSSPEVIASSPHPSIRSLREAFGMRRPAKPTSAGLPTASFGQVPLDTPSPIATPSKSPFEAQFAEALDRSHRQLPDDVLRTPGLTSAQPPLIQTPSTSGLPLTPKSPSPGSSTSSSTTPRRRPLTPHATSPTSAVRPMSIPPFPAALAKDAANRLIGQAYTREEMRGQHM